MIIILSTLAIIGYMINGIIGLIFQLATFVMYNKSIRTNKYSYIERLIGLWIISIPTSFIDIIGRPYGTSPISWFNIITILGSVYILIKIAKNKFNNNSMGIFSLLIIMLIMFYLISIIRSIGAITTFFTISAPLFLILLISIITDIDLNYDKLKKTYVEVVISCAIALFFQIMIYKMIRVEVGHIEYMANRIAFGILFSDISFISLYLASGSMISIYRFLEENRFKDFFIGGVLILASMMTTARTGLAGVAVSILIILSRGILKREKFIKYIIYIPILVCVAIICIYIFKDMRDGQDILSLSGRDNGYKTAIDVFKNNKLIGTGIGADSYSNYISTNFYGASTILPHNIIIQSLAQTGLIGTVLVMNIVFIPIIQGLRFKNKEVIMMYISTIAGSFFIPDILNSRFMIVQMMLIIIQYKLNKQFSNRCRNWV